MSLEKLQYEYHFNVPIVVAFLRKEPIKLEFIEKNSHVYDYIAYLKLKYKEKIVVEEEKNGFQISWRN